MTREYISYNFGFLDCMFIIIFHKNVNASFYVVNYNNGPRDDGAAKSINFASTDWLIHILFFIYLPQSTLVKIIFLIHIFRKFILVNYCSVRVLFWIEEIANVSFS